MNKKIRNDFLGISLDNLSLSETVDKIELFIQERRPRQHVVLNAAKVVHAYYNPRLKSILNDCDLINADGQAVVWAARFLGIPLKERIAGIDLMQKLIETASYKGWCLFFLGAKNEVVHNVVEYFSTKFPGLKICGYHHGYFSSKDEKQIVENIRLSGTDILFVAMSSPRKEEFLNKYLNDLNVPFSMGVGGSFDIIAGKTRRAPYWMQKYGLEWFYRIMQEPGRMWKRYAKTNPLFIYLVFKHKLNGFLNHAS